jgi:hypothetical protein
VAALALTALVLGTGSWLVYGRGVRAASMPGRLPGPAVLVGYADGRPVRFVHTEASDPAVARLLGRMTGRPVTVVPSLADLAGRGTGRVFVFANGVRRGPRGPLGYQADVFDSSPGQRGYRPLRRVVIVRWSPGARPRILRSAAAVAAAAAAGELRATPTGWVVNMPVVG